MIVADGLDNLAGAMGNIALVALIMALCDTRFSAFQYAVLSTFALLPRYSLGGPAGWIADHGGWHDVLRGELRDRSSGSSDRLAASGQDAPDRYSAPMTATRPSMSSA